MNTKTLLSVVGPTAIGKTKLAITLAQHFNTEIISADSRQFFKEMAIGTAVPDKDELAAAPHHFIQHKSILESYSVGDFEKEALKKLDLLFKEKDIAILVGGSGLYVDAVIKGLDSFPKVDTSVRAGLNTLFEEEGVTALQQKLEDLDPEYYNKVDKDNPHRLIRALEVCIGSGKPYSTFLNQEKPKRPFNVITIGITADREIIYDRINTRVDLMEQNGLLNEAKALTEHQNLNALQTVGYRELFQFFNGNWTLEFALSEIKKNTRRFAKRQLTWFKKNKETLWVNFNDDPKNIIATIKEKLQA
ncbi:MULTISPECIES: tRNA (adenosine(37)-N6)-dimethylallyltransferase MiaA [unclassified Cellulophaga]|uniref:tRNA (adenosine(37)-N6)-dimethylallyltransferase MiaA n=1 Tax=unclassified Cellulophaga TaxID=2634405 RepID=UPI0026E3A1F9|nr:MULTISPECIES: tRNA (adenosine(37)-N6)-dimethylallyltransferase MiaA [unclassified Cellulophaga]MDO6490825.1 tRNA (adenosine(37)-N6)-dimethylallyltransferase MiaA [Cellulophaga sp. 2_MG-2023]MDO6493981.1 tRNA (adenosine(37)-N6)-dimethylallyltransferase MiaA [Cellulophaga sp. 3_MG-2023]